MDFIAMKKKLIKNGFSKGASFVLAAATVFFLIMGFSNLWGNRDEAENLIDHKSTANAYVYLDAVAFEEWVCKYGDDTYYTLYDNSGNIYLAVISNGTMNSMSRKAAGSEDYYHYFDGSYRLYGLVKMTSTSVISLVEQAYGISKSEYSKYFGSYYLDATDSPTANTAWMWLTFAIFSGLFTLIFGVIWIGSKRPFIKENSDYTEEEFARAAQLMDETDKKQKLIFGEEFIINRNSGMLVRYKDILWVHLVDVYYNGASVGLMLRIYTSKRNSYKLSPAVKNSDQELADMMNKIIEKNPEVLVGHTPENKQTYDSLTRS